MAHVTEHWWLVGGSCVFGGTTKQFFMDKAAFGAIMQIVENRFVWFGHSAFKFQRPDWICSSFSPIFKFTRLVEIANIHRGRGEPFLFHTNRSLVRKGRFC